MAPHPVHQNGVMRDPLTPVLDVAGASVRFGRESALDSVSFRMFPGEVHSLIGENGAGKSTLIKALTGALALDSGELHLDGAPVRLRTGPPCSTPTCPESLPGCGSMRPRQTHS